MSTQKRPRGFFLVFEGGEGAGKSTQLAHLVKRLEGRRLPFITTHEPGGTRLGAEIRKLLLHSAKGAIAPLAELLLYEADRAHHVETVVRPALAAGKIVISDRFVDSSTVYQGICRGLGAKRVAELNQFATGNLWPDLVLLLDISEKVGLSRIQKRRGLDRIEQEAASFHRQVRRGFLSLAKASPRRFAVIDASRSEAEIAAEIASVVERRLERKRIWKAR